jgi:hypothetical protein
MVSASAIALGKLFLFHNYRPSYILFFVTSRCEANCSHCFYWQQRNNVTNELSLPQIEKFVQQCGPVVQVTLTGGSPELRKDLPEIAGLFWHYCRPFNVTLCSNGNNPDKLYDDVKKIYDQFPEYKLTVDISLDGLFEEHDRLRGIAGLFENVLRSYRLLHDLQKKYANLRLGCGLCVTGLNKLTALATARWAMDNLPIDNFTPILVRGEPQNPQALNTDSSVFMKIADEVERRLSIGAFRGYASFSRIVNKKDVIQKRLIHRIYASRQSPIRCSAARETAVVYPDGMVGGCELRNEVLGSLPQVNMDIAAIWRNPQAKQFRDSIRDEKCSCWHQCFLSPTIVKSPSLWLWPKALQ